MAEAHTRTRQSTLQQLEKTYQSCYPNAGFPKCKRQCNRAAFTQKQSADFDYNDQTSKIPNIGPTGTTAYACPGKLGQTPLANRRLGLRNPIGANGNSRVGQRR